MQLFSAILSHFAILLIRFDNIAHMCLCEHDVPPKNDKQRAERRRRSKKKEREMRKTNKLSINSSKTNKEENVHAKCERQQRRTDEQQRNWLYGHYVIE